MLNQNPTIDDEIELVRNREDKSRLDIHTMRPEKLLAIDVAHSDQVKDLTLYLDFDECNDWYEQHKKYLYKKDCECENKYCNKCYWEYKYTDTLCKDLVNFNNLEKLKLFNLNLSSDLWIQFAKGCTCLKKISFDGGSANQFGFDDDSKKEALETIFKIPTLEKVVFRWLDLSFFPKGQSNVKYLKMDRVTYSNDYPVPDRTKQEIYQNFSVNFSTHTNITSLVVNQRTESPFKFSTLRIHQLQNLENLEFNGVLDKDGFDSLKAILKLPKLQTIDMDLTFDELDGAEKGVTHIEGNCSLMTTQRTLTANNDTISKDRVVQLILTNKDIRFAGSTPPACRATAPPSGCPKGRKSYGNVTLSTRTTFQEIPALVGRLRELVSSFDDSKLNVFAFPNDTFPTNLSEILLKHKTEFLG